MDRKVALVTGGARGIGAAICEKLASIGYYVYVNHRSDKPENYRLLKNIRSSGGKADLIYFDITRTEDIQAALECFNEKKLDLLVFNAGMLKDELIYKIDLDTWHKVLDTNYFGSVQLFELFKEKLHKADSPIVVSISSISGIKPRVGQAAYAVSKSMMIEWTRRMAASQENKINFYCISPGPVNTELLKKTKWANRDGALKRIPLGRFIEPEEIAVIVCLLNKNNFVKNGFNIIYDAGFINTVKE